MQLSPTGSQTLCVITEVDSETSSVPPGGQQAEVQQKKKKKNTHSSSVQMKLKVASVVVSHVLSE